MSLKDATKKRRLNVVVSESLFESLAEHAENRGMSMSEFVREAVERECKRTQERMLAEAAVSLASLYATDRELIAFSALDGDEFA